MNRDIQPIIMRTVDSFCPDKVATGIILCNEGITTTRACQGGFVSFPCTKGRWCSTEETSHIAVAHSINPNAQTVIMMGAACFSCPNHVAAGVVLHNKGLAIT